MRGQVGSRTVLGMYCIADQRRNRIAGLSALDPDGLVQPLVPPAEIGPMSAPSGLCLDGARLRIADSGHGRIVTVSLDTGGWSAFSTGVMVRPVDVASDARHRIYAVDGERLARADGEDGSGLVMMPGLAAGQRPVAITVDGERIVIADARERRIWASGDDGASWAPIALPDAGAPPALVSLAPAAGGGVLVTDLANRRVVAVDPDGATKTVITPEDGLIAPVAARADGPGITVLDAGALWVRRFLPVNGRYVAADFVRGRAAGGQSRFDRPAGLAVGAFE